MSSEKLIDELIARLNDKNLHEVRQLGRAIGVPHSTDRLKDHLIEEIIEYAAGRKDFSAVTKRGAPPKSQEYDRQLAADILNCRAYCLGKNLPVEKQEGHNIYVGSGDDSSLDFASGGILDKDGDRWILRTTGCREDFVSDVSVDFRLIKLYSLRAGDFVEGRCRRESVSDVAELADVSKVNGLRADTLKRPDFDSLVPVYPDSKLKISRGAWDKTGRIIDLFAPIGAGQRVLAVGPHGCGKTHILKDIAEGVQQNNPSVKLVIVLIDVSPEDAADFNQSFSLADVFTSTFDSGYASHVKTMRLALEYCKRQAELCRQVVLVVDDMTRLIRAYNSVDRHVTLGLDNTAVDETKKLLGAARNTSSCGSLTVISALSLNTGDIVDDAAYSALKDVCNAKIALSYSLSKNRVYPPIDIEASYSRYEERLSTDEELRAAMKLREKGVDEIFALLASTEDNSDLLNKI